MCHKQLVGKDLNLLVALHVLLREQNVTRAAAAVGLSQPAMSRTLNRLRSLFDDPLLVRTPKGMTPTPRALALVQPLRATLEGVEQLIRGPELVPATAKGIFRIAANDHAASVVLPWFLERIRSEAPGIQIQIEGARRDDESLLEADQLDLVLGRFSDAGASIFCRKLFSDTHVCLLRADHPALAGEWTAETFAALDHALVSTYPESQANIDIALKRSGLRRRTVASIPHAQVAFAVASSSDLAVTLPRYIAAQGPGPETVCQLEVPVRVAPQAVLQYWHERRQNDPLHIWIRRCMADGFAATLSDAHKHPQRGVRAPLDLGSAASTPASTRTSGPAPDPAPRLQVCSAG